MPTYGFCDHIGAINCEDLGEERRASGKGEDGTYDEIHEVLLLEKNLISNKDVSPSKVLCCVCYAFTSPTFPNQRATVSEQIGL